MKSVTWFEILTRVWTATLVFGKSSLGQSANFDIIPGSLVYYQEVDSRQRPDPAFQNGPRLSEPYRVDHQHDHHHHSHHRHYLKGSQRLTQGEGVSKQLPPNRRGRQGPQCRSRCTIIPDRDFCPTDIVEEIDEDDFTSTEYSNENSIEYSEEYYSGEDEDDDEKDYSDEYDDNKRTRLGNKPKLRLTSSMGRGSTPSLEGRNRSESENGSGGLYLVYPSLTKFAVERAKQSNGGEVDKKRNRIQGRQRRRQRRLKQMGRLVRLRPSALEQEIIIRWDRVVERGPYIGGDIVVPEGVRLRPPSFRYFKNYWPDGVVPYEMDPSLNSCRVNSIFDAMDEIEEKTCIRFVERKKERNFVDIRRSPFGCSSYVGMIGGAQHLNLSTGCFSKFTVTHELMHALGFDHEQSRKDRDKHVDIDFDNVLNEKQGQFELNPAFTGSRLPYDLRSIMHYSAFLFARNKCEPTIYPVDEKINLCDLGIGNGRGGMTNCDAVKLNTMYKCGRKYSKKCKVQK